MCSRYEATRRSRVARQNYLNPLSRFIWAFLELPPRGVTGERESSLENLISKKHRSQTYENCFWPSWMKISRRSCKIISFDAGICQLIRPLCRDYTHDIVFVAVCNSQTIVFIARRENFICRHNYNCCLYINVEEIYLESFSDEQSWTHMWIFDNILSSTCT